MSIELYRLKAMVAPDQDTWDLSERDVQAIRWALEQIETDHNVKNAMLESINKLNARTPGPHTTKMMEMCQRWIDSVDAPRYLKPEIRDAMLAFIAENRSAEPETEET